VPNLRQLYALQELDRELQKKQTELARLQTKFSEPSSLQEARRGVAQEQQKLSDFERERKALDLEVSSLIEKRKAGERKLYDGSIRSPKELKAQQDEVNSLQKRQRDLEDKIIALMEAIEEQQAKVTAAQEGLESQESRWRAEKQQLQEQMGLLQRETEEMLPQRHSLSPDIEPELLSRYESLRTGKQGLVVAKVERGLCQGCRITVPVSVLQRARAGREVVTCPSCGRILFVS
jgi:predicted  nucleic acid-binding Zn-ribbon protein